MKQSMILLHGLFGQLSNWSSVTAHFGLHYDVYVPALPVYDLPANDQLLYLTSYLETFIEEHRLKEVILVGNSLGGHIAILYTARHGNNVKGLILTGSSGLYENTNMGSYPRRNSYQYIRDRVEYTFHDPAMATEALVSEVLEVTTNSRKCLSTLRIARSAQRNYVADLLPGICTPTLLIWGRNDRITPVHVAHEFEQKLPKADLVVFEECGHAPMMEKPDAFNQTLERYLHAHQNY